MKAFMLALGSLTVLGLTGCSTESVTQCTKAAQTTWQDQDAFQEELKGQGYEINEFKVTPGNCYEIYGTNADGEKVEIYFDPVDGTIVKEESH